MALDFVLPDLGEGLTEAEIVGWLVAPGDEVAIDQVVVELESAKSVVQLPSPFAGVVTSLGGGIGQVLHAGEVLLTLGEASGDDDPAIPDVSPAAASVAAEPGVAVPTDSTSEASGAVLIGYGTRTRERASRPVGQPRFGRRGGPEADVAPVATGASVGVLIDPTRRSPVVSPIVRRMAREHGFDASGLLGTGRDHLVLRRDVERAISERARHDASAPVFDRPGDRRIPLDRAARTAAAHYTRSRREIPDATAWLDADATGLVVARRELERTTGERFSATALIARFVVAGLARHPSLNASFDAEHDELVLHGAVNLGVAAQTPRGLMVPVVHDAQHLTLRALRDALAERSEQAKTGVYPPPALTGGTFTLNNYGVLGVDGSTAIINHPEAAMLGVGRFMERPWAVDGELAVRTVVELTLSFDHRVCDGAEASAFLTFVAGCIERPISLLAEI